MAESKRTMLRSSSGKNLYGVRGRGEEVDARARGGSLHASCPWP
jgi:hypothetical protein